MVQIKSHLVNFVSGAVGSGVAFTEVAPAVQPEQLPTDTNSLVTAIVTIVGGLVSTLLTGLLKKWLGKSKETEKLN